MQALALPRKTIAEIDQICANFLRDSTIDKKRTHLVTWNRVCAPTNQGGLNVRKASLLNQFSLVKLCWKLNNSKNLASTLIREKYISNRSCPTKFKNDSHIWQDLGKGWDNFSSLTEWCIGKGENILLWDDNCIGKGPLRAIIHGPMAANEEHLKVSDIISNKCWNLSVLSFPIPIHLQHWILVIPISPTSNDFPVCSMWKGKFFDSKSTYAYLWKESFNHLGNMKDWSLIWDAVCHPKQKTFLWLLL